MTVIQHDVQEVIWLIADFLGDRSHLIQVERRGDFGQEEEVRLQARRALGGFGSFGRRRGMVRDGSTGGSRRWRGRRLDQGRSLGPGVRQGDGSVDKCRRFGSGYNPEFGASALGTGRLAGTRSPLRPSGALWGLGAAAIVRGVPLSPAEDATRRRRIVPSACAHGGAMTAGALHTSELRLAEASGVAVELASMALARDAFLAGSLDFQAGEIEDLLNEIDLLSLGRLVEDDQDKVERDFGSTVRHTVNLSDGEILGLEILKDEVRVDLFGESADNHAENLLILERMSVEGDMGVPEGAGGPTVFVGRGDGDGNAVGVVFAREADTTV